MLSRILISFSRPKIAFTASLAAFSTDVIYVILNVILNVILIMCGIQKRFN